METYTQEQFESLVRTYQGALRELREVKAELHGLRLDYVRLAKAAASVVEYDDPFTDRIAVSRLIGDLRRALTGVNR